MLKQVAILLAVVILLSAVPVAAQSTISTVYDVPDGEYSSLDSYTTDDMFNEYRITVPRSYEMDYSVVANGTGTFRIFVIPEHGTEYVLQSSYYIHYSSPQLVSEYTNTIPADYGFARELTIAINSTANMTYQIDVHINEVSKDYTLYYIAVIGGVVGLVLFSWFYVNWQVKQEKLAEEKAREERRSKRGRSKRKR